MIDQEFSTAHTPPILIIGLGNPVLGDDSVGWHVVHQVQPLLADLAGTYEVDCLAVGGLNLMERLAGYRQVILVDAMTTGQQALGSIICLTFEDLPDLTAGHLTSVHDTSLPTAMRLGRALDIPLPDQIVIVGIETTPTYDFTETLSPPIAAAIPGAAQQVVELVQQLSQRA